MANQTVNIPLLFDTYTDSNASTTDSKTSGFIRVGYSSPSTYTSFLVPDFTGIPTNATIVSATLNLRTTGTPVGTNISLVTKLTTGAVNTAGFGYSTQPGIDDFRTFAQKTNTIASPATNTWYTWDVKELIQHMTSTGSLNYGIAITGPTSGSAYITFSSMQDATSTYRPYIAITYDDATITKRVPISADTYVISGSPTTAYDTALTLSFGASTAITYTRALNSDLDSFTGIGTIYSATLLTKLSTASGGTGVPQVANWDGTTGMTWNTKVATVASTDAETTWSTNSAYIYVNVKDAMTKILKGTYPHYALAFIGNATSAGFVAKDYPSYPYITVTYDQKTSGSDQTLTDTETVKGSDYSELSVTESIKDATYSDLSTTESVYLPGWTKVTPAIYSDTYKDSTSPSTDHSAETTFTVYHSTSTGAYKDAYIVPDLTSLPSNAYIVSAKLTLNKTSSSTSNITAYLTDGQANQPTALPTLDADTTWVQTVTNTSAAGSYDFDVTELIRYLMNAQTYYGIVLRTESNITHTFSSKEAGVSGPKLTVIYDSTKFTRKVFMTSDTYVDSTTPTTSYDATGTLKFGGTSKVYLKPYQTVVDAIGSNVAIESAVFRGKLTGVGGATGIPALVQWDGTTALTWDTKPAETPTSDASTSIASDGMGNSISLTDAMSKVITSSVYKGYAICFSGNSTSVTLASQESAQRLRPAVYVTYHSVSYSELPTTETLIDNTGSDELDAYESVTAAGYTITADELVTVETIQAPVVLSTPVEDYVSDIYGHGYSYKTGNAYSMVGLDFIGDFQRKQETYGSYTYSLITNPGAFADSYYDMAYGTLDLTVSSDFITPVHSDSGNLRLYVSSLTYTQSDVNNSSRSFRLTVDGTAYDSMIRISAIGADENGRNYIDLPIPLSIDHIHSGSKLVLSKWYPNATHGQRGGLVTDALISYNEIRYMTPGLVELDSTENLKAATADGAGIAGYAELGGTEITLGATNVNTRHTIAYCTYSAEYIDTASGYPLETNRTTPPVMIGSWNIEATASAPQPIDQLENLPTTAVSYITAKMKNNPATFAQPQYSSNQKLKAYVTNSTYDQTDIYNHDRRFTLTVDGYAYDAPLYIATITTELGRTCLSFPIPKCFPQIKSTSELIFKLYEPQKHMGKYGNLEILTIEYDETNYTYPGNSQLDSTETIWPSSSVDTTEHVDGFYSDLRTSEKAIGAGNKELKTTENIRVFAASSDMEMVTYEYTMPSGNLVAREVELPVIFDTTVEEAYPDDNNAKWNTTWMGVQNGMKEVAYYTVNLTSLPKGCIINKAQIYLTAYYNRLSYSFLTDYVKFKGSVTTSKIDMNGFGWTLRPPADMDGPVREFAMKQGYGAGTWYVTDFTPHIQYALNHKVTQPTLIFTPNQGVDGWFDFYSLEGDIKVLYDKPFIKVQYMVPENGNYTDMEELSTWERVLAADNLETDEQVTIEGYEVGLYKLSTFENIRKETDPYLGTKGAATLSMSEQVQWIGYYQRYDWIYAQEHVTYNAALYDEQYLSVPVTFDTFVQSNYDYSSTDDTIMYLGHGSETGVKTRIGDDTIYPYFEGWVYAVPENFTVPAGAIITQAWLKAWRLTQYPADTIGWTPADTPGWGQSQSTANDTAIRSTNNIDPDPWDPRAHDDRPMLVTKSGEEVPYQSDVEIRIPVSPPIRSGFGWTDRIMPDMSKPGFIGIIPLGGPGWIRFPVTNQLNILAQEGKLDYGIMLKPSGPRPEGIVDADPNNGMYPDYVTGTVTYAYELQRHVQLYSSDSEMNVINILYGGVSGSVKPTFEITLLIPKFNVGTTNLNATERVQTGYTSDLSTTERTSSVLYVNMNTSETVAVNTGNSQLNATETLKPPVIAEIDATERLIPVQIASVDVTETVDFGDPAYSEVWVTETASLIAPGYSELYHRETVIQMNPGVAELTVTETTDQYVKPSPSQDVSAKTAKLLAKLDKAFEAYGRDADFCYSTGTNNSVFEYVQGVKILVTNPVMTEENLTLTGSKVYYEQYEVYIKANDIEKLDKNSWRYNSCSLWCDYGGRWMRVKNMQISTLGNDTVYARVLIWADNAVGSPDFTYIDPELDFPIPHWTP